MKTRYEEKAEELLDELETVPVVGSNDRSNLDHDLLEASSLVVTSQDCEGILEYDGKVGKTFYAIDNEECLYVFQETDEPWVHLTRIRDDVYQVSVPEDETELENLTYEEAVRVLVAFWEKHA